jgi:uncharacterized protein (DUF302 family)
MQDEVRRPSRHDFTETVRRLAEIVQTHGTNLAARVDHAKAAATVGLTLRPTEVFIFGNPAVGTKLMQLSDTIGLDLPLKILVTADEQGTCWLIYADPAALAQRHALPAAASAILHGMAGGLASIVDELAKA